MGAEPGRGKVGPGGAGGPPDEPTRAAGSGLVPAASLDLVPAAGRRLGTRLPGWPGLAAGSFLLAVLVGCSDTGEDLEAYLFGPGGMEAVLAEESRVIEQFNEQVNQDVQSEQRAQGVARLLRERVLPAYTGVLGRMRRLQVDNKRVLELHNAYLEITARQKQVFEELLGMLEAEDFGALTRVNLHLAKLRNRRTDWEQELRRLCEKYEVTYRRE